MKKLFVTIAVLTAVGTSVARAAVKSFALSSPDGRISVSVSIDENSTNPVSYGVSLNSQLLVSDREIGLVFDGNTIAKKVSSKKNAINEAVDAPFQRNPHIRDHYNELTLSFANKTGVVFRAYNNGVAYRFFTTSKDSLTIKGEAFRPTFAQQYEASYAYSTNKQKPFAMAFQNCYTDNVDSERLAFLPFALSAQNGVKLVFTEADLEAYPGMFVRPQKSGVEGMFPPYPAEMALYNWRLQDYVKAGADYIARTAGTRAFPWRVWAIAEQDAELPVNDLVYLLAAPNRIGDVSWIKPGKVAWDWWNDWGLTGVPFRAGINTQTYKYYIDFASKYGLEYIILDEGWYDPGKGDMLTVVPEVNLPELIAYGKSKNVDIVLWTVFNVLDRQLEDACRRYSGMGVKGFKVDFLDRNDQKAVERTYRIADAAARHRLFLDLHGFYSPTGMSRTYPNVLTYEAVFGMEEVKWTAKETDFPKYDVTFPFLRMLCGTVDYTPGAMRNATKSEWQAHYSTPQSMGTRTHQAATYVVYDSPFTMFCDAPTMYEREPEYTRYVASIPTIFDETRILKAKMGEYIVTARRKGSAWYIGALTNWDRRDIEIALDFLDDDFMYQIDLLEDGINADRQASDYRIRTVDVMAGQPILFHLAQGGGAVAKITLK